MKGELDCIACAVKQILNTARVATDDHELHKKVLREVMAYLLKSDWEDSPADVSTGAYHLLHRITQNPDPYKEMKREQNKNALRLLPDMYRMIEQSEDKLHTAAKLAVVGNIIDCGIRQDHDITFELESGMKLDMAVDEFEEFRRMLQDAERVFYACDNAGEIVFDRLFMEQIKAAKPHIDLIACVRGGLILNDVTREDAEVVGIHNIARLVDTGLAAIGIPLDKISTELRSLMEQSDIIISKGQGNFETLDELTNGKVFFILRAKCDLIAAKFNVPLNAIVFERFK